MKAWLPGDLWDGMRTQPGRIALSLFAIAIGMLALTLLVSVTSGLERRSDRIIRELGVNVVALLASGEPGSTGLQRPHVDLLRTHFPDAEVSGITRHAIDDPASEEALELLAVDAAIFRTRPWRLRDGRWLDATDLRGREHHCLVSEALARERSWTVGTFIPLGRDWFRIVGVMDAGGAGSDFSNPALNPGSRLVVVPHRVEPYWQTRGASRAAAVDVLYIKVPIDQDIAAVTRRIHRVMEPEIRRGVSFSILTADSLVAGLRRFQRTIHLAMGSVSLLCLLLGGTTLMSLMIASVKERLAEIGLRLSLGASGRDIALLFLLEGLLVSLVAAALGMLIAHAGLYLAGDRIAVPVHMGWISVGAPLAAAAVVGAVFSFIPARLAAGIEPWEALRNE